MLHKYKNIITAINITEFNNFLVKMFTINFHITYINFITRETLLLLNNITLLLLNNITIYIKHTHKYLLYFNLNKILKNFLL